MTKVSDGGPAFPVPGLMHDETFNGMTLRDYFAAKAMQGLMSDPNVSGPWKAFAKDAYEMADAMLEERSK